MTMGRSGDGFVRGSDGHVRWGLFGAAGVVFVVADADGEPHVLLQLRSAFSHEGGTWSCPGGALDAGESPLDGALREATEEVGAPPEPRRLLGEHRFAPALEWSYTTVVVEVPERFGRPMNFETEAVEWVPRRRRGDPPAARRVRRRLALAPADHPTRRQGRRGRSLRCPRRLWARTFSLSRASAPRWRLENDQRWPRAHRASFSSSAASQGKARRRAVRSSSGASSSSCALVQRRAVDVRDVGRLVAPPVGESGLVLHLKRYSHGPDGS